MNTETTDIEFDSRRTLLFVFFFLLALELLMFILDIFVNWNEFADRESIRDMFSTTQEHSIAGWFAATQTFIVALAAWAIFFISKKTDASTWQRAGWFVIAAFFSYLSVDDGAAIHEHLGSGLKQTAIIGEAIASYDSYSWHVVILPFFIAMGCFILFFLWRELAHINEKLGTLAAFSCLGFAIIQDYIEGSTEEYDWFEINYDMDAETILHFAKSLEECAEMLGMTIFLVVFLSHLMRTWSKITLRFN